MLKIAIAFILALLPALSDDDYKERHHIPKDLSYLNLNQKQKKTVKKILKEHIKNLKKIHEEEERLEEWLKKEFPKNSFPKEAFLKMSIKLKNKIAKEEAEFFSEIHKILSPKQREEFIEYIEEWEVE